MRVIRVLNVATFAATVSEQRAVSCPKLKDIAKSVKVECFCMNLTKLAGGGKKPSHYINKVFYIYSFGFVKGIIPKKFIAGEMLI